MLASGLHSGRHPTSLTMNSDVQNVWSYLWNRPVANHQG